MLELQHLNKSFQSRPILRDICLSAKLGSINIFLGPSGVGKSTLLRVLCGLETLDSGVILYEGRPLNTTVIHTNHTIGMVFQQFSLFKHLTAIENIMLVLEKVMNFSAKDAQKKAMDLLHQFDLADQANRYVSRLSGGQQQRLAIARALAVQPKILCLDEPTSALDPLLTKQVAAIIKKLSQLGYTLFITTHDMSLIQDLQGTVYLMQSGSIIETATSQDLINNPSDFIRIGEFMRGTKHSE